MNHLIARTKGREGEFYKVISGKSIFSLPADLENTKCYEASYKLDDDEWFILDKFSEKEYCTDFLKNGFISTEYAQLAKNNYSTIDYLCSVQGGKYFFQKMTSSLFLKRKWISISSTPTLVENQAMIILNNSPDAIYFKKEDILYFKKLTTISSIFRGIEILYREATNSETVEFLKNDFIQLKNGYNSDSVKTANRKRIAMAMDTLAKFTDKEKKGVFKYIKEYCKDVKFSHDSFEIKTEEDLKQILYGIEQRYYTTLLGKEKRLANSITKL